MSQQELPIDLNRLREVADVERLKDVLKQFRAWWEKVPNSMRAKPNLARTRLAEVEYLDFFQDFSKVWANLGNEVLAALMTKSDGLDARTIEETRSLVHWGFDAIRGIVDDFAEVSAELGPACAEILISGGKLRAAIVQWAKQIVGLYSLVKRMPLVMPPVAIWGCSPKRQDVAAGVAEFGWWAMQAESQALPWHSPTNFLLPNEDNTVPVERAKLHEAIRNALDRKWLLRIGDGPERWNSFLRESSAETVWIAWALARLVTSWQVPAADPRDPAMIRGHLLQVSKGYRAWLRDYFAPAQAVNPGDAQLADVFPTYDIAYRRPKDAISESGSPDYPRLHRIASFVWYACERIAVEGEASRLKKSWHQRAWLGPAIEFIKRNQAATFTDVAKHVGKPVSTVSRNETVRTLLSANVREVRKGFRKSDGDVEAPVDPDE